MVCFASAKRARQRRMLILSEKQEAPAEFVHGFGKAGEVPLPDEQNGQQGQGDGQNHNRQPAVFPEPDPKWLAIGERVVDFNQFKQLARKAYRGIEAGLVSHQMVAAQFQIQHQF